MVLSIRYRLSRDLAANVSKVRFQMPRRDQPLKRLGPSFKANSATVDRAMCAGARHIEDHVHDLAIVGVSALRDQRLKQSRFIVGQN